MTETEFNKAIDALSQTTLSPTAKQEMLARVYETSINEVTQPIASAWSFSFASGYRSLSAYGLTLALILISGTAYASSVSLPGDTLYGFKVKVLEPLVLLSRWDETDQNEYKIALLQKRIGELQALKASGRINTQAGYASHVATERNVAAIEHSAVFDQTGHNSRVSSYIDTYNELAGAEFELATIIKTGVTSPTIASTTTEMEVAEEASLASEAANVAKEAAQEAASIVHTAATNMESATMSAEETVHTPVRTIIAPVKADLGL